MSQTKQCDGKPKKLHSPYRGIRGNKGINRLPRVDFLTWCIDVLASRYSWTRKSCLEELYWEEFWKHVIIAANFTAEERNAQMRFEFMLHADKKSARKWQDLPIPFPPEKGETVESKSKSGISQLPSNLQHTVYRPDTIASNKK